MFDAAVQTLGAKIEIRGAAAQSLARRRLWRTKKEILGALVA